MSRLPHFLAGIILVGTLTALLIPDDSISGRPRIIDGDTLQISEHRIRLWGINAPERNTPLGPSATAYLQRIINDATVTCYPRDTDKWGRIVAQCFVMGRDIARDMVDSGHAIDMPRYSRGYYSPK